MFLFTKNKKLATNEQEEFDDLKDLLIENSEEISYNTGSQLVRTFEWESEENVRLGVSIDEEELTFEFWVEVKSHIPYFCDKSEDLDLKEIIYEMSRINTDISDYIKEKSVSDDELMKLIGVKL